MGASSHTSLRRHALLGTTALFLIASGVGGLPAPAFADFNDGTAAYEAGDYTRAYNEWLPLARAGNAAAQRNIGQLYRLGLGVPKDLKVAANWYRLAAEQGLARAQANLGVMYLRGEGVERDPAKAADWFAQAADQGHTISQYNLALMYEQGYGVARDKTQAARWFEQAAAGGHDKAGDRLAALLSESVIPAAGAPVRPEPALPVQTARTEEYVPARILNRDQRAAAPEPEDEAPPPARQQVAAAPPAPKPEAASAPDDNVRHRADRLTEVLTAPPSPADIAGTPAARFAVRPEPAPPQQVAKLPESAPETRGLSRPAFLRPNETAKREDKPVEVALSDTPRSAPARTAPAAQPIIEVPVAPFLKDEAQRARPSAAIRKPPVEARPVEAPVAPFLKAEAKAADAPAKPAVPVEPVQVAAITPPPDPAPKPQSARKAALTVPSAPAVRGKAVPEFLQREAMAPPPGLDLESRYGPNSYLAPREIPIVVRLDAVPNVPPRKRPDPAPASAALLPRGEDRPAPPNPQDTPAFLIREARDPQVPPREPPPQRDAPVQVAALPVVPRSDAPPAPTPASDETTPPSPFGSRIPMFYVRLAQELATDVPAAETQVAALTVPRTAAKVAPEVLVQSALRAKPLPPILRDEPAAAVAAAPRGDRAALVVDPEPAPAFLRREARLDIEPEAAAPVHKPAPSFLSAEAKVPQRQDAPAEAPRVVVAVPEFLREEALAIESEDEAPLRIAALPERSAPAFLTGEAAAVKVPEAQESVIAAAPPGATIRGASDAAPEIAASAAPVPAFIRDEAQTGAMAMVDTPRVGDPVGRVKRVTALLDAAESAAQAQAPRTVPQYYQDRAALVAELEKAGDEPAPLPFLRRAPRADAKAPIQPTPDLIVAEARQSQAPVSPFLRAEAQDAQRQRAVPGAGDRARGDTRVAARATDRTRDTATLAKRTGETAEDRRAVDAGVAAYLGRDYEKALSFWQPAATRGNPDAQFFVAGLYLDGNGVPRDLISAHVWFARSADQGHARAAEQLGLLRKIMTQDQFAEAERRRRAD